MTLLGLLAGCSGSPGADGAIAPDAEVGWVTEVARHPESFTALTATDRDGWIAYHAQRLPDAVAAFPSDPVGRGRVELDLAQLYDDLGQIAETANEDLFAAWAARGPLPSPDAPMIAALAASCAGEPERARSWAAKAHGGPDDAVAAAIEAGANLFDPETKVDGTGPVATRLAIHRAARASGDPEALRKAASEPMIERTEADGFVRKLWDPCVYATLSEVWRSRARADLGGATLPALVAPDAGLGTRLFAPWPTTADLQAELASAPSFGLVGDGAPSVRRLGVEAAPIPTDDGEAAKREVRALDAGLDAIRLQIDDTAPAEGAAVVRELGLVKRFRQEWLVVHSRAALAQGHPLRALTYAELARDHSARAIGPENGPSLFAMVALARLRLGHTREALDALHVLGDVYPETLGLVETTGDLAVLRGLDRQADSKED